MLNFHWTTSNLRKYSLLPFIKYLRKPSASLIFVIGSRLFPVFKTLCLNLYLLLLLFFWAICQKVLYNELNERSYFKAVNCIPALLISEYRTELLLLFYSVKELHFSCSIFFRCLALKVIRYFAYWFLLITWLPGSIHPTETFETSLIHTTTVFFIGKLVFLLE